MKDSYPWVSLERICCLLGVTRQSYYKHLREGEKVGLEHGVILSRVREIRSIHPMIGCRKLHYLLRPFLCEHKMKIGRDALFDLLCSHHLLVRKRSRRVYTTNSFHWLRKYPNLIKEIVPTRANEIWVSDITYFKTKTGFVYISFITDAYSRKIVGYHAAETLEAVHTIRALKMAISENSGQLKGLVHHSDRGVQYCSNDYVKLLQDNNVLISMTEKGNPLENAIAERLNGIMKQEYLEHQVTEDVMEAMELLSHSVYTYNNLRPHMSCNMQTPEKVHKDNMGTKRKWKNYYKQRKVEM